MAKYIPVIGVEIHLQIATDRKMFCECEINPNALPNTNICPVCTGQPGTLPVPNLGAVELGVRLATALGSTLSDSVRFDRKNYFYPDLPKGYQITQYYHPLASGGELAADYLLGGERVVKQVGIHHMHLEEDTGKSSHGKGATLIDYNRAGVPLIEIVTEPDLENGLQTVRFLQELQSVATLSEVSRAEMENGHMRADVNISLKKASASKLPDYKVEIKNLNSFSAIEKAINYEIERQATILDKGEVPQRETRGWVENKGETVSQRNKEDLADYRYFAEPDLPAFKTPSTDAAKDHYSAWYTRRDQLRQMTGLAWEKIYTLTDKFIHSFGDFSWLKEVFEGLTEDESALMANLLLRLDKEKSQTIFPKHAAEILGVLIGQQINWSALETLDWAGIEEGEIGEYLAAMNVIYTVGEDLKEYIDQVIANNPEEVQRYKEGKVGLIGFFVGEALKLGKGKLSPAELKREFESRLTD